MNTKTLLERLEKLIDVGLALSAETDPVHLQESILESAMVLAHADGGTLYSISQGDVRIKILRNTSLNLSIGGRRGQTGTLPSIPILLYNSDGSPNLNNVVTLAVHTSATVNIADAYSTEDLNLTGTRHFDAQTGYHSTSFLTVPLRNHDNDIIGVLQLINAIEPKTGAVIPFDTPTQRLVEALASLAATGLTKELLIGEIKQMIESLIHLNANTVVERLEKLIDVGIALSAETDPVRLQEGILNSAMALTHADGGTLYSVSHEAVHIEILRNASLNMAMGGRSAPPCTLPDIPLHKPDGSPNLNNVVTFAVHTNATVNIPDSYDTENFDFSGTRRFDTQTGYRSTSFLTVPLRNHENEIIGVLQIINAIEPKTGAVIPFDTITQRLIEALASQAAIGLTKGQLIGEIKKLFESLIHLIADAIDRKSAYTGGHCRRVPAITMALAEAAHNEMEGPLQDFQLTDQDRYELEIAGWLHDCGKITTPEYVVDKATKLETICDRIHLVDSRFEILRRDAEIECLKRQLVSLGVTEPESALQQELQAKQTELDEQREFLKRCNIGGEFMSEQDQKRVRSIGQRTWLLDDKLAPLLSENEVYNLTIARGTLTTEERQVINDHIRATIDMLHTLPFPKHLRRVPEYAGGHHERMDGKGYPNGLTREQMSVQARILGIADIFEALTASDRPYKSAKTLSESLKIMAYMKKDGHIDPDLFDVFVRHHAYRQYAERFLNPEQIDDVDVEKLLAGP